MSYQEADIKTLTREKLPSILKDKRPKVAAADFPLTINVVPYGESSKSQYQPYRAELTFHVSRPSVGEDQMGSDPVNVVVYWIKRKAEGNRPEDDNYVINKVTVSGFPIM